MTERVVFDAACAMALLGAGRDVISAAGLRWRPEEQGVLTPDLWGPFTLASDEPLTSEQAEAYCEAGGWVQQGDLQIRPEPAGGFAWWLTG